MSNEELTEDVPTADQIARRYAAALDSVSVINDLMALSSRTAEQADKVSRNVEHLELMVAKDYWTTEDLAPLNAAIAAGKA